MVPEADERESKEEAKCSTKLSNLILIALGKLGKGNDTFIKDIIIKRDKGK